MAKVVSSWSFFDIEDLFWCLENPQCWFLSKLLLKFIYFGNLIGSLLVHFTSSDLAGFNFRWQTNSSDKNRILEVPSIAVVIIELLPLS